MKWRSRIFLREDIFQKWGNASYTPPKTNMGTQNDALFEAGDTFLKPSFGGKISGGLHLRISLTTVENKAELPTKPTKRSIFPSFFLGSQKTAYVS